MPPLLTKIKKVIGRLYRMLRYYSPYARLSFAQEGEDIILDKIFQFQRTGFYVDIGAHHPQRYSNTAIFYQRGWSGINIDPVPGTKKLFDKKRPRDVNLELGIAAKPGQLTYHMFTPSAYNTCSAEKAAQVKKQGVTCHGTQVIAVLPLADILQQYLPPGQQIDFMSVDVEALDLEVLQSNDWDKYKPRVVLVEMLRTNLEDCAQDPIYKLMRASGYSLMSKAVNTAIFKRNDFDHANPPR